MASTELGASSDPAAAAPSPQRQVRVQVEGRVLQLDSAVLQHFNTITQFLGAEEEDGQQQQQPANSNDPDACTAPVKATFCLPGWLSLPLWEQLLTYPGLQLDAAQPGAAAPQPACIAFMLACQESLHDIARAAEFLGCAPLVELASAACLLRLRSYITTAADLSALSDDALVTQATTAPHTEEELQLLFHPSDAELDASWMSKVVRVPLAQFWPLVDQLVLAGVVPAAGVVPGLIRALIWPCISEHRVGEVVVVGLPGKGQSGEYLNLHIPAETLLAYDARVLLCNVSSHDQGWGGSPQDKNTYNGSWTFGTLEVNGEQQDGRLYTNLTACHTLQQHIKVLGAGSGAIGALTTFAAGLRSQQPWGGPEGEGGEGEGGGEDVGAHITVTQHAVFKGWKNSVSEARLECFFLPKGAVVGRSG